MLSFFYLNLENNEVSKNVEVIDNYISTKNEQITLILGTSRINKTRRVIKSLNRIFFVEEIRNQKNNGI